MYTFYRILITALIFPMSSSLRAEDAPLPRAQATLFTANNGVDSNRCGTSAAPCRSISRAIANAKSGDKIVVGPGAYGDVNDDGALTPGSGDEIPANGAMISVTKPLSIVSRFGADATTLRFAAGNSGATAAVAIAAKGVAFGQHGAGFSIVGADNCYMGISESGLGQNSTIEGNVITRCNEGIHVTGVGMMINDNQALANANNGFTIQSEGAVVKNNRAIANGGAGFTVESLNWRMLNNVAINNAVHGAYIDGNGEFTGNAMIANKAIGLIVNGFLVDGYVNVVISKNSFYGNLGHHVSNTDINCGMVNNTLTALDARNNFWGAKSGPGPDPADKICGNEIQAVPALAADNAIQSVNAEGCSSELKSGVLTLPCVNVIDDFGGTSQYNATMELLPAIIPLQFKLTAANRL